MRALPRAVKPSGNWPPRRLHGSVRGMRKALLLLAIGAVFAVVLVQLDGKTLWERAQRRGLPQAASRIVRGALSWVGGAQRKRPVASAAPAAAAGRRASEPSPERILKAPPKERLSPDDRASLDHLVTTRSR